MQCQQDPSLSSHPLPPSSSSSSLSSSSSHQQQHRLIGPTTPSSLPPAGKEMLRNESDAQGHIYYNKQNTPTAPMSPSEDELPTRYGRRLGRQSSWAETERRPSSYYDGLRTPDSDRRDERMASLEALRKRREIPVSVRTRSSSLGRDQASILNDAMELKGNDETLTAKATRNILDLSSRSSSITGDMSVESGERSRRGTSSLLESLEGSERSRRGTSSINESLESSDRSRRGTSSINDSRSNSPDRSILEKFLHMKERRDTSSAARERRRNISKGENDFEVDGVAKDEKSRCPRPQSLNIPGSLTQSWNGDPYIGDFKDEGSPKEVTDGETSNKKKGHRISRFLRPDFFDTPREESIFAKRKDLEADTNAENEQKLKEQQPAKSGFLHSLEKRLDKLRGGEKSRKVNSLEVEPNVLGVEGSAAVPECLTSTKMAAEVRKAKSVGPEDVMNPDGTKKGFGSSRVDRAINSLLQREKIKGKKEVSESGLIKRAVGIHERSCPSKSRSSGELSLFSVNSGPSLGKILTTQKNSASPSGGEIPVNGVGTETPASGKFSSKVNSMLGIFRRNEVDVTPPVNQNKRVRRTQSLAYDKSVPDDILSAIAGYDSLKNNVVVCNEIAASEPKPSLALPENTSLKAVSKVEKVKKSSKAAKEKSNVAKSKTSQQKEKKIVSGKLDKANEESSKETSYEKSLLPVLGKKDIKKEKNSAPVSKNNSYDITVTLPKPSKKDTVLNIDVPTKNDVQNPETNSLISAQVNSSGRFDDNEKLKYSKNLECFKKKLHINSMNETRVEGKELDYKEPSQNLYAKQLDRTATQDSLDSSWSACSDGGVGDVIGEGRKIPRYHDGHGFGESMDPATPPMNHLRSPSPIGADSCGGEKGSRRIDVDDDSEESVGDRIRRKSFYCRFNEVPSRRKSRKSSASSLLYSASDLWNTLESKPDTHRHKSHRKSSGGGRSSSSASSGSALDGNSLDSSLLQLGYRTSAESKKAESKSSDSRCSFSPPPLLTKPSAVIYRRSSTSPYQDRLPPPDSVLHSTLNSKGLRPASSASSLVKSNGSNRTTDVDEESTSIGLWRGGEGGYASYIPSPLSPSSSMSNSYHNGVLPSHTNETSLELDRKGHRMRKFGVPSLADGITAPSPTHRKYNNSTHCSSDGLVPSAGGSVSGPSSLLSEITPQAVNTAELPPLGVSVSNKMRIMRNSLGQN